ncbi:MAG: oligosaccharide flippase family protein, partial [Methanobacterium sp.]
MNAARRVAKNTLVLFTAQIISYVFAFFGNMYMARYLGADGYGVISLALALTGI